MSLPEDSAGALLREIAQQEIPSREVWKEIKTDTELYLRVRMLCGRLFSHAAPSSRAKWLAQAMTNRENPPRATIHTALRIIGL